MKSIMFVFCFLSLIVFSGCQTVSEGVRTSSETAGAVLAVPQAVTQGITSGYVDQTGKPQSNPYGR